MKTKHRKVVPKTRSHKVEVKRNVSILQHPISRDNEKRKEASKKEHCEDSEREGDKDGCSEGEREDTEECSQVEQSRDTENSEKSVHPGPIQTVSGLPESAAVTPKSDETQIESEELPPWVC